MENRSTGERFHGKEFNQRERRLEKEDEKTNQYSTTILGHSCFDSGDAAEQRLPGGGAGRERNPICGAG